MQLFVLGSTIVLFGLLDRSYVESYLIHRLPSYRSNLRRYPRRPLLHADVSTDDDCIGVGIDLGTTNSAVSILKDGIPVILEIEGNGRTMPSVVNFEGDIVHVGKEAVEREAMHPKSTYRNVKRIIGTGNKIAQDISNLIPNMVIKEEPKPKKKKWKKKKKKKKGRGDFQAQERDAIINPAMLHSPTRDNFEMISPEFISSQVLRKLFDTATAHTGKKVDRAVIGIPAYFKPTQKDATIRACNLAGVQKVKLLYEPEAAALNYNSGKEQIGQGETDELVFVFDLGGGTYDVSMLRVGGGLTEVLATHGNAMLGGSDFDFHIAQHLNKIVRQNRNTNDETNFMAIPDVRDVMVRAAEAVRIFLSNNKRVQIALPSTQDGWMALAEGSDIILEDIREDITEDAVATETHVNVELSRKTIEDICKNDIESLLRPIRECALMSNAMLPGDASPRAVEEALESEKEFQTAVQDSYIFEDFYDSDDDSSDNEKDEDIDEDMILKVRNIDLKEAKRLAQRGRKKARKLAKEEKKYRTEKRKLKTSGKKLREISGRPISRVVLVGGVTRMPAIGRLIGKLTGVIPQRTVNPDEAVAMGCAIQAGLYDNDTNLEGSTVMTPMQAAIMRFMLKNDKQFEENMKMQEELEQDQMNFSKIKEMYDDEKGDLMNDSMEDWEKVEEISQPIEGYEDEGNNDVMDDSMEGWTKIGGFGQK